MTEENLKTWKEVAEELSLANNVTKNTLLGNGFSLAWDYKKFNQQKLKLDINVLKDLPAENVESCIEELQKVSHQKDEYQKAVKEIINIKIKTDFMKVLFNKLPKRLNSAKAKPFVEFLNIFDNYFTLNYDSLLYFLLNKFKKDNNCNPTLKAETQKIEKTQEQTKKEESEKTTKENAKVKIQEQLKPIIQEILSAKWLIMSTDNEKLLEEDINEQTHTFIRNKLSIVLKNKKNIPDSIKEEIFNKNDELKREYKTFVNNTIDEIKEGVVEDALKLLNINDGFLKQNEFLEWNETSTCNFFHLHGAFHIIKDNEKFIKITSTTANSMMSEIEDYLNESKNPVTILEGNSQDKEKNIGENKYLEYCYQNLKSSNGILLTLGISFADNDDHITNAIIKNTDLQKVYIGILKNPEGKYKDLAHIKDKFKGISDKIVYFEANEVFKGEENE